MFTTGWWKSSRAWFSRSNRNYCGYLAAAWLWEIIITVLLILGFFDVAWVHFALARLSREFSS